MKYTSSKEELFRSVAHKLKGRWHNFMTDDILVFSPAKAPLDVSDLLLIKDGTARADYYLLGMSAEGEVYAVLGDNNGVSNAVIKVITHDTLILQLSNCNMMIYERRQSTDFADEVIAGL